MSLLILFDNQIQGYLPIENLLLKQCAEESNHYPITIVMGDDDWVLKSDDGASPRLVSHLNKRESDHSSYHVLPGSGHNLNLDNPRGIVNLIFNECFGMKEPVLRPEQYRATAR